MSLESKTDRLMLLRKRIYFLAYLTSEQTTSLYFWLLSATPIIFLNFDLAYVILDVKINPMSPRLSISNKPLKS